MGEALHDACWLEVAPSSEQPDNHPCNVDFFLRVHSFQTSMRERAEDEVVQLLPREKLHSLYESSITRLGASSSVLREEHNLHGPELY